MNLTDLITNFASYETRFGAYDRGGVQHPGFIGRTDANILTEDFAISVRANANALPYRGIDLTTAGAASVSSIRSQVDNLFDFEDPSWMRVEGLVEGEPSIASLSFHIVEHPEFVEGGLSPIPEGFGSSDAWLLPAWTLERVVVSAARTALFDLDTEIAYYSPGDEHPLFSASVDDGFQAISVRGGLGSPPAPSYMWDALLEVAQVRLHDGDLPEGEGNVQFTLHDVPLGTTTAELEERVKENLAASPEALLQLTEHVLASTNGEADLYYYRARDDNPAALAGDWLFFVVEGDIERDEDGSPVREYAYAHPGFYRDAALTDKVSTQDALDGDTEHEKVRLDDFAELYVEDADDAVYRLTRGDKPSLGRITLAIERVR